MIRINIQHNGYVRMQRKKRIYILTGFRNKKLFPARIHIALDARQHTADMNRGFHASTVIDL